MLRQLIWAPRYDVLLMFSFFSLCVVDLTAQRRVGSSLSASQSCFLFNCSLKVTTDELFTFVLLTAEMNVCEIQMCNRVYIYWHAQTAKHKDIIGFTCWSRNIEPRLSLFDLFLKLCVNICVREKLSAGFTNVSETCILHTHVHVEFQSPLTYQVRTTVQLICIQQHPENSMKGKAASQSWNNSKCNTDKTKQNTDSFVEVKIVLTRVYEKTKIHDLSA